MDDHIRKLNTRIHNKEAELNALYTTLHKLEEEIATLHHKKLISRKLETAEMSLTGVLEVRSLKWRRRRKVRTRGDLKKLCNVYNFIYNGVCWTWI